MSKKSKGSKGLLNDVQDILERDPQRALKELFRIVDKLGNLQDTISEEEQNQLRIKPSKELKAVTSLLQNEKLMAAFLKQLDEASTKDTLELYLRYMAKLSTVPMFTEQLSRFDIAPCFFRIGEALLALQTPSFRKQREFARSAEYHYALATYSLLNNSLSFREGARQAGLFPRFLAVFRKKWESEYGAEQADWSTLWDAAFSLYYAVSAVQAFAKDSPQVLVGTAAGEWIADLFQFMDRMWNGVVGQPAPPEGTRPMILENMIDNFASLLQMIVNYDLKALPSIEDKKGLICRVVKSKVLPYLKSEPVVYLYRSPTQVDFLLAAVAYLGDGKREEQRTPSSQRAAEGVEMTRAVALLRAGKWQKARGFLKATATDLKNCTDKQAEALVAAGFVGSVLDILRLTIPGELESLAAATATEKAAVIEGALNLLAAVIPKLDRTKPSVPDVCFTTALQLLQWSADLRARKEILTEDAYTRVLRLVELARLQGLPVPMQIAHVDLAVSAIKMYPHTPTAGVAWGALAHLKTLALKLGDRGPWAGAECAADAEEYLWRPSSDSNLPTGAAGFDSVAMWNVSKVFNHWGRRLCLDALEHLRNVARCEHTWFGMGAALINALEACCRNPLVVQLVVLPRVETLVRSLSLVHASLVAVFGPLRADDAPQVPDLDAVGRDKIVIGIVLEDLARVLRAVLRAMTHPVGDQQTKETLRNKTLLEAARAGAAAACASVLRDLRALRAVAPTEAAGGTLEGAVRRLWEELALEYDLKACSNPACQGELVEESKRTFRTCARCRLAYYCSKECQVEHWASGHRRHCSTSTA